MAGYAKVPGLLMLSATLLFEAVENMRRPKKTIPFLSPESTVNILMDISATMGGWMIGRAVRERRERAR